MDFVVYLPKSKKGTIVLVVVDKVGHFIALKPRFTGKIIAHVFIYSWLKCMAFLPLLFWIET